MNLPADAPVVSCFEAGRDEFWVHRYLVAQGITNHVVDSSSIEVNRRARRAKTDRLDFGGLLSLLMRYVQGDRRARHVVRVPTVSEEDARQVHRTGEMVQQGRNRLISHQRFVDDPALYAPPTGARNVTGFLDDVTAAYVFTATINGGTDGSLARPNDLRHGSGEPGHAPGISNVLRRQLHCPLRLQRVCNYMKKWFIWRRERDSNPR